jgi:asparagine synthase (glutamine-hydrolysing)
MFLSGGVDSTALVALARETGVTPRTFSVVMPGTAHDEGRFSREVAARFACDHTEVPLTEGELAAAVPDALTSFDHPTGDGINTFIVSRAVARAGLKVALSGLGGDEIFGGYPSFDRLRRLAAYSRVWGRSPAIVRTAAAAAVRSVGRASTSSAKMAAVLESDGSVPRAFPILRQVFGRADRRALLAGTDATTDATADRLAAMAARHPDRDVMTFISYAESSTYMHDVLLRDSDQMSMASGLELRVPLLDHSLVEYVVGLPEGLKAARGLPKRLLVESVGPAMPMDVVNRPKRGFVLPFDRWMRGDLRELCEHHLGPSGGLRRAGLRHDGVKAIWHGFLETERTTWSRPWTLVALGAWLEALAVNA